MVLVGMIVRWIIYGWGESFWLELLMLFCRRVFGNVHHEIFFEILAILGKDWLRDDFLFFIVNKMLTKLETHDKELTFE